MLNGFVVAFTVVSVLGLKFIGCPPSNNCTNETNQCQEQVAQNCLMTCTMGPCAYNNHQVNCQEQGLGACVMSTEKPYPFMCNSGMAGFGDGPWAACEKWLEPECSMEENRCEGNVAYSCHKYCCDDNDDGTIDENRECVYYPSVRDCNDSVSSGTCELNDLGEANCVYPTETPTPCTDPTGCANPQVLN